MPMCPYHVSLFGSLMMCEKTFQSAINANELTAGHPLASMDTLGSAAVMCALLALIYLLRGEENTNEVIPSPSKFRKHSPLTGMICCLSAVRDSDTLVCSRLCLLFFTQLLSSLSLCLRVLLSMPLYPYTPINFSLMPLQKSKIAVLTLIFQLMFEHLSFSFTGVLKNFKTLLVQN